MRCISRPLRGLKRSAHLSTGLPRLMHLAPLTGIETNSKSYSICRFIRCISRPLRGLKQKYSSIICMSCWMHLAPLTGIETWRRSVIRWMHDASRAPYGDWNNYLYLIFVFMFWCISRPLRGLKQCPMEQWKSQARMHLAPLTGIETLSSIV